MMFAVHRRRFGDKIGWFDSVEGAVPMDASDLFADLSLLVISKSSEKKTGWV